MLDAQEREQALAEAIKLYENLSVDSIKDLTADYDLGGDMDDKETLIGWVFACACARMTKIELSCERPIRFILGAVNIVTGEAGEVAYLGEHVVSTFNKGSLDSPEGFWEMVEGVTLDLLGFNDLLAPFNPKGLNGNVPLNLRSTCCSALETLGLSVDNECDHKDGGGLHQTAGRARVHLPQQRNQGRARMTNALICHHCGAIISTVIERQTHVITFNKYIIKGVDGKLVLATCDGQVDSDTTNLTETTWQCPECSGDLQLNQWTANNEPIPYDKEDEADQQEGLKFATD